MNAYQRAGFAVEKAHINTYSRPTGRAELRRRAFEANLSANLTDVLGGDVHPANLAKLVRVMGQAHSETHHMIDARTTIGAGRYRYYVVLQAGFFQKERWPRGCGPLAASVISKTPADMLDVFSEKELSLIADCIDRAEITRIHSVDWRPRAKVRIAEFYINLLAGEDRRSSGARVSDDRRAPVDEGWGAFTLMTLFLAIAGLGLWLMVMVLGQVWYLMTDEAAWQLLFGR